MRCGYVCTAPNPPLCKGRWHGASRDERIVQQGVAKLDIPMQIRMVLRIRRSTFNFADASCAILQSPAATAPFTQGSLTGARIDSASKRGTAQRFASLPLISPLRGQLPPEGKPISHRREIFRQGKARERRRIGYTPSEQQRRPGGKDPPAIFNASGSALPCRPCTAGGIWGW